MGLIHVRTAGLRPHERSFEQGRNDAPQRPAWRIIIICFIHGAGGQVLSPELEVAIESPEAVNALEFYRSIREFCPPGATGYSWGESLSAFVSGAAATGLYAGRVLVNVNNRNPRLKEYVTCVQFPTMSPDIPAWTFNDYPSVFIPADAPDRELTRRFAAWL